MSSKFSKIQSLNNLLPFVAIGTIADCQSILEPTNRLLVKAGLQILQKNNNLNPGLREILVQTGLAEKMEQKYKLGSQDLGFLFSPILNSSGRMSHARLSIAALVKTEDLVENLDKTKNLDKAYLDNEIKLLLQQKTVDLVRQLLQTNQDRKDNVKGILEEVEAQAKQQFEANSQVIWLEGDWSKGIIGLLASSLVSRYNLPVIVIEKNLEIDLKENAKSAASLRAPEGYHLPNAMKKTGENLFEKFGGHPCAAGFTALSSNLEKIREGMQKNLFKQKQSLETEKTSYLPTNWKYTLPEDFANLEYQKNLIFLEKDELDSQFLRDLMLLDPFGQDFKMPELVFCLDSFGLRWMGQNQQHVRVDFDSGDVKSMSVNIFNLEPEIAKILKTYNTDKTSRPQKLWVVARVSQNSWQGNTTLQLIAHKVCLHD